MIAWIVLAPFAIFLSAYVAYQLLLFAANALIGDPPPIVADRTRRFMCSCRRTTKSCTCPACWKPGRATVSA